MRFRLKIEKLSMILCKVTGNYLPSSEAIGVSMLVSCLLEDEAVPETPLSCSLEAKAMPERPLRIKKAGFLGTGKFAVSLLSITTTFDMVGRSDGSSCTHKSATFTHLEAHRCCKSHVMSRPLNPMPRLLSIISKP